MQLQSSNLISVHGILPLASEPSDNIPAIQQHLMLMYKRNSVIA